MSAQVTAHDFPEIRWRGQWIWCPEEPIVPNPALIPTVDFSAKEAHGLFRKTLHLDEVPERVRHYDLGALGQHAPGRYDQPWRDDLLQSLCAGRRRRLAAPLGWRARSGGSGLPRTGDAPAAGGWSDSRPCTTSHPLRPGRVRVADLRWPGGGRSRRAAQHHGNRGPPQEPGGAESGRVGQVRLDLPLRLT
jgi:hypothetical protein